MPFNMQEKKRKNKSDSAALLQSESLNSPLRPSRWASALPSVFRMFGYQATRQRLPDTCEGVWPLVPEPLSWTSPAPAQNVHRLALPATGHSERVEGRGRPVKLLGSRPRQRLLRINCTPHSGGPNRAFATYLEYGADSSGTE